MNVSFSNVRKSYPSGFSLRIPSLRIGAGQRIGVVGNNGAGKTTLLRILLGLLQFENGDVTLDGASVRSFSLEWRTKVSSYLSEAGLIPFLTPLEFWQFVGDAYGVPRTEQRIRLQEYERFVKAEDDPWVTSTFIRDHSQGNRKKVGLTAALMAKPRLLVLDEPFTNLDPKSRALLEAMLIQLNESDGVTLVISSHDLGNIVDVSTRILLIDDGKIAFDGPSNAETLRFVREHLTGGVLKRAVV